MTIQATLALVIVALSVLAALLYVGRSLWPSRPGQTVYCPVPDPIIHPTVTVVFPGANGGADDGREVFAWIEAEYGHVIVCDYGRTWFHGDTVAQLAATQLLPLKGQDIELVLIGCSKGMLTMLDVFAHLRRYGFDTGRIHLGAVDGALGTDNTILVSKSLVRKAWLLRWIPVGRVANVLGRRIMRNLGSPDYQLSHLAGHIRHVLARSSSLPDLFVGVNKIVYLRGGAKDNRVLKQPTEQNRVHGVAKAAGVTFSLLNVAGGGHCDLDDRPGVWKKAIDEMFYDRFNIDRISDHLRDNVVV